MQKQKVTPAKKAAWLNKPSIGWENSRRQCMCRTGKGGPGSSTRILLKEAGGPKNAWKEAQKWLKDAMKKYEDDMAK